MKEEVTKRILVVNTDYITGRTLKMLDIVQGVVLHQGGGGGSTGTYGVSSLKAMAGAGGDLLTQMLVKARAEAKAAMLEEAEDLDADAVVNVTYHSSMISETACEIMYTGTAVKFVKPVQQSR
ncbi:MAG: heavy metal-binding domain-containing protein [Firmicutes bacterium]|nr:heavy metal-binding domain-containing protein [Bacillota bacterium]